MHVETEPYLFLQKILDLFYVFLLDQQVRRVLRHCESVSSMSYVRRGPTVSQDELVWSIAVRVEVQEDLLGRRVADC